MEPLWVGFSKTDETSTVSYLLDCTLRFQFAFQILLWESSSSTKMSYKYLCMSRKKIMLRAISGYTNLLSVSVMNIVLVVTMINYWQNANMYRQSRLQPACTRLLCVMPPCTTRITLFRLSTFWKSFAALHIARKNNFPLSSSNMSMQNFKEENVCRGSWCKVSS